MKAVSTLTELRKGIVKDEFEEVLLKIIEKQKFKINFDENKTIKIKEKIVSELREKGLLPLGIEASSVSAQSLTGSETRLNISQSLR